MRFDTAVADCLLQVIDHIWDSVDDFLHTAVCFIDRQSDHAFAVFAVQFICYLAQVFLTDLKLHGAVVTDDHTQCCFLAGGIAADDMEESLPAVGILWLFVRRQGGHEFVGDIDRVFHDAFGCAGMNADAFDFDNCFRSIECFVFVVAKIIAVQCIGDR